MAYYRDFREHLRALEERGKLTRIKRPVNKDTQLHPLVRLQFRGLPEEERTAFLFENVTDSNGRRYCIPVAVAALAGSSQIYAIGMMCQPEEISERLTRAEMNPVAPKLVPGGPVQEEVHLGDGLLAHGGLAEFPIPVTTPGYDAATYMTAPYWVSRDPDTGAANLGMYRAMVKSPTRTGVMFMSQNQGSQIHWRKCKERGIPLEAAIVIGGPPSLGYVAVSKLPIGTSEYAVAGGIAGEPLELVRCRTVDLEVPAHAEIVVEGELSTQELEPEAPFGEAWGFIGPTEMMPYFTVRCITHRRNPVWVATVSQYPPSESSKIRQHANEGTLFKHLRHDQNMPFVLGVGCFDTLGSSRTLAVRLKKPDTAGVWRALEAAAKRFPLGKIIIAVDEDVNVHDLDSVNLALCMRALPHRDFRIVKVPAPSNMDFSVRNPAEEADMAAEASIVLIDATMKWPLPPVSLPKKEFMDEALKIWQEEGLPRLKLKEPWWGGNLGYWDEEKDALAAAVTSGAHYRAGDVYAARRRPA